MEIKRGDVFLVDFNPARGSEQAGLRPAVVIQNNVGNKYSPTVIVAVISTSAHEGYPFLVPLSAEEGGLKKDSVVNAAQILTIDKSRLIKKLGNLSEKMDKINKAIKISLSLD